MKIVADSSPLITLAKISQLEILPQLYRSILITPEVYGEVAVTGAGLAGAAETSTAKWIEVRSLRDTSRFAGAQQELDLGIGEVSAILLAIELAGVYCESCHSKNIGPAKPLIFKAMTSDFP